VIVREKLSKRAVVKKMGSDGVSSREEINTIGTYESDTKSKSKTQTVSNGRVGRRVKKLRSLKECPNIGDLVSGRIEA